MNPHRGAALALLVMASLAGGFLLGRWSLPPAQPLIVGSAQPQPERDISPKGEVRTVIVTRITPGPPAPPPAQPKDLGQHLTTTTTALPPLSLGGTFHSAHFGQVEGTRLTLRTVTWLDSPTGRVSLGESTTRETQATFTLPQARPIPRWTVALLPTVQDGRLTAGGLIEHTRGPMVIGAGYLDRRSFGILGVRW